MVHGRSSFLVIRLSPFEAEGTTLVYPDSIEITLSLQYSPAFGRVSAPTDMVQPADIEPDWEPSPQLWDVGEYTAPAPLSAGASYYNTIPPTECVIIVGSSGYNSSVQPLAQWKTMKGIYTRVVETTWITSRYSGVDTAEDIRLYLQDLYNNEELKWVILGGDHGDVPSRLVYVPDEHQDIAGSDGVNASSDAYYADLAGSGHSPYDWDGNNDGWFGEITVDGIDLTAEVYVGRLSATSTTQMGTLVDNILNYERDPPTGGWFNRSVLAGAYSNYDTTAVVWNDRNDTTDEANLSEAIRLDFMDNGTKINYTLYEQAGIWPSQQPCNASLTTSNLISAIDNGTSMVNLAGHGSYMSIHRQIWNSDANGNGLCDSGEYSSPSYYTTSASHGNGGMKPLFYNDACNNGEFDRQTNCLTEDILRDVGIGAIGSSRVSWYAVHWNKGTDGGPANQGHDYRFWEQMLDEGHYHPGKALYKSKSDYISDRSLSNGTWKNLLQYNLMGDPEVPIWNQVPGNLNVSYPTPLASPGSPTFTVKDGSGNPVSGARVCMMNGSNFFGVATTDGNGQCQITLPSVLQYMNLTVTMYNFLPYEEEVMVGVDVIRPEILSVLVGGNLSTGDVFGISAVASDNVGVSGAYLEYNWSSSSPSSSYNTTMAEIGSDTFYFTSSHPLDSLDPIWYRVHIHDAAGNWNQTSWAQTAIVDNDTVIFGQDGSQLEATTGDPYTFQVNISDNIGVSGGAVEYWYGTGASFNISLAGGPTSFTAGIIIPWNSTDMLHYIFRSCDGAGNWNSSTQGNVDVTDDDRPSLDLDRTPSAGTTGDPFSFNVTASDNIAVGSIRIEYWFGGAPHENRTSVGAGQFIYTMDLPDDSVEPLHYLLHIVDSSGNDISTVQKDVMIVDDDLPEFMEDHAGPDPTTGDPF
ncbi:MAG: hypothetical protein KAH57_00970, partial [Thermoplasmata archaeon]|nr:hypothetical protein [Thermoplasmata archaeon]